MTFLSIGFPGLGLDRFSINRYLFTIGNFSLSIYGLVIAIGFLAAVLYCTRRTKDFNLSPDEIIDMLICAVPSAIVGARLYYCVFNWTYYREHPLEILSFSSIRDGGLAIYGGIIAALLAAGIFCRIRRIHVGAMFDIGALGLLIGQSIGRWGNFFNVEVYGVETALPWRMRVFETPFSVLNPPLDVHPLFLYESLWNVLGFVLLHFLSKRIRKFNGQIFLCYVAWYGIGRGFLEGLRDPEYILNIFGDSVAVSQVLAFVSAVLALLILAYFLIFRDHDPEKMTAWTAARDARLQSKTRAKAERTADAGDSGPKTGDGFADIDPDEYTPQSLDGQNTDEKPEKPGEEGENDGDPA